MRIVKGQVHKILSVMIMVVIIVMILFLVFKS